MQNNHYPEYYNIRWALAAIRLEVPIEYCKVCGKIAIFTGRFTSFCSKDCSHSEQGNKIRHDNAKRTNLEVYGFENPMQNSVVKNKTVATTKLKHSGIGTGSSSIKAKIDQTNLKRRGVTNPFSDVIVIDKIQNTHLQKYGSHYSQQHISAEALQLLSDKSYLQSLIDNEEPFYKASNKLGITVSTLLKHIRKSGLVPHRKSRSQLELTFEQLLIENDFNNFIKNDRDILVGREIDFYFPDNKIAIEIDGLYWHSEVFDNAKAKLVKTQMAYRKDVKLIHVFEDEILYKPEIVISRVRSLLGENQKIFARKCQVRELSFIEKRNFFNNTHIDGDTSSSFAYALIYNDEIVQAISIMKSRFDKTVDFEIIRSSSKQGITVIGGLSKLFSHIKHLGSFITFADLRWGEGSSYEKAGFIREEDTNPGYSYFKSSEGIKRHSRLKFQKSKLKNLLSNFDQTLSEADNMHNNGWLKIFDCGNAKYSYHKGA